MISVNYSDENILKSPEFSVLTHICNTYENWTDGIGKDLKLTYKYAYYTYDIHCSGQGYIVYDSSSDDMSLLIPPCESDPSVPKYWIACMLIGTAYKKNHPNITELSSKLTEIIRELIDDVISVRLKGSHILSIKISESELLYLGIQRKDFEKIISKISLLDPHKIIIDVHTT